MDLNDHPETPLIQVAIGPDEISFLTEVVFGNNGNLFNFLWFPGISADSKNGPIL